MRILAIETSGATQSVAALDGGDLLVDLPLNRVQRGAQSLAPTLAQLLRQVSWKPSDIELVAVAVGPGSFTSLRVGVTTAKTFAYAISAHVLGIGTLEIIAAQATDIAPGGQVAVAIDAQRGDVYAALYRAGVQGSGSNTQRVPGVQGELEVLQPPAIVRADQWIASLAGDMQASGPALEKLAERVPPGVRVASPDQWQPTASTLAQLAAAKHAAGERGDVWHLNPLYLRKSAAEEKIS